MGLFFNKVNYLGIDIGTSSIKVVELANFNGRPRLVTYGFTERKLTEERDVSDLISNESEVVAIVNDICKKSRTTTKKVIASLPNFSVFTSILTLPQMPKKDLESAIEWEAKNIIPIPLENVNLDWTVIKESEEERQEASLDKRAEIIGQENKPFHTINAKNKNNIRVMVTGANKDLVAKYMGIFHKTGLNLISLETENSALIRSMIGADLSSVMILDLGASTSSIAVVDKGIPVLSRTIDVGGLAITRSVAVSLNVGLDRAEQFKQDLFLGGEELESPLPALVEKSFAPIMQEIKYALNLFEEQQGKKVEKIILTGGSAMLGNLASHLSKSLSINCYLGDPW
ncbi:MAG: pilus assembly protein PilM, partial [bacterium]